MKVEKLAVSSSTNFQTSLPKGHLNSFLCLLKDTSSRPTDFLTRVSTVNVSAKYVGNKVHHLIPNLPLLPFVELSSQNYGFGGYIDYSIVKSIDDFSDVDHHATDSYDDVTNMALPVMVDLGSIYNNSGNETFISFENLKGIEVTVYSLSFDLKTPFLRTYDFDADFNEVHKMVNHVYLFSKTFPTSSTNILVETDTENYSYDVLGAQAVTSLFSKLESPATNLFNVFSTDIGLQKDVWIKIQGLTPSTTSGLFLIRESSPTELQGTSNSKVRELENSVVKSVEEMSSNNALPYSAAKVLELKYAGDGLMKSALEFKNINNPRLKI